MATFNVKEFCTQPDLESLQTAKISKDDWKYIAKFFEVSYSSRQSKAQLKEIVIIALVDGDYLPTEALQLLECPTANSPSKVFSVKDYDDELITSNPSESLRLSTKRDVENMSDVLLSESQIKFEHRKLDEQKIEREWEGQNFHLLADEEERKHQCKLAEVELQVKLAELNSRGSSTSFPSGKGKAFDVSKKSALVGSFEEKYPEAFFDAFEKLAKQLKWDPKYWTVLIQTKFVGKARQVYNNLSTEESQDYKTVKDTIMLAYDQVPETYREKFRGLQKTQNCTYIELLMNMFIYLTSG